LFGNLIQVRYDRSYEFIENKIAKYNAHNSIELIIEDYKDYSKIIELPNHIEYGIQDAGLAPNKYNRSIKIILTPGSYLDPGKRSKGDMNYGFDLILEKDTFINLGMPMITKITSKLLDDQACIIHIEFDKMTPIKVLFSKDFEAKFGDIQYFKGNSKKNEYFNKDPLSDEVAYKFILSKELGDTSQAIYGKQYAKSIEQGVKKVCLFTNDNVLSLRCRLLHLQVVYNVCSGKSNKTFYYYPVMSDITNAFVEMWSNNIGIHNNWVINIVENIIDKGEYLLVNGAIVRFNATSPVKEVLDRFINNTKQREIDFKKINPSHVGLDNYRRYAKAHQVPRLFVGNILNMAALNMPIFSNKDRDILLGFIKVGGGFEKAALPPFIFENPEEDDYTIDREYDDAFESSVRTKHALYKVFSEKYHDKSKDELCYIIDGISSVLFLYFGFVGSSSSHPEFAMNIFQKYDKGIFGSQSLLEFEREYNCWANNEQCEYKVEHSAVRNTTFKKQRPYAMVYGGKRKTRRIKRK
jgi:hypothetical protein